MTNNMSEIEYKLTPDEIRSRGLEIDEMKSGPDKLQILRDAKENVCGTYNPETKTATLFNLSIRTSEIKR